jgi:hypothetical protein
VNPPPKPFDKNTDLVKLRAANIKSKVDYAQANATTSGDVVTEDLQIPVRDGATITARIYRPTTPPAEGSPVFVMYHGGGFCLGGLESEDLNCRIWAEKFGGVAVNVEYRLAPEHKFPVPVNDAYDALKWVHFHPLVIWYIVNLRLQHLDRSKHGNYKGKPLPRIYRWRHIRRCKLFGGSFALVPRRGMLTTADGTVPVHPTCVGNRGRSRRV